MNTNERIKIFKSLMGQAFSKEEVEYFVAIFRRMGYFTAPASTKYHGNYEGGLFDHSLEVTKSLLHLTKTPETSLEQQEESLCCGYVS